MSDDELVSRVLERVSRYSSREAAELLGVSHTKVTDWRKGIVAELIPSTRRALEDFLETSATNSRLVREAPGEYSAAAENAIERLLDMLGLEGGMRRAARERGPADMVKTAYRVAIDDNWPPKLRTELDKVREQILRG